MVNHSGLTVFAGLLLFASAAALLAPHYSLRNELPPSNCGFADYGSAVGVAQRLVETQLTPGVADWNIAVPMPPPCIGAPMTGVDIRVCDGDTPPDVTLNDMRSARVHRTGQLTGFATVNVTVYCIIEKPTPLPSPPPLDASRADAMSTIELSNELSSYEVTSKEETPDELESVILASAELATTVNPTSTISLPPVQEKTTELPLPTEVVTHQPNLAIHPQETIPPSLKVTINITPNNRVSTEEDVESYNKELPLLSNKEKSNEVMSSHSPRFSSDPYIVTPPRMSGMPHQPGSPQYQPYPPYPAHFPVAPVDTLPPYPLQSPYPLPQLYRPYSLFNSRLRFLQRRHPLLFFRQY